MKVDLISGSESGQDVDDSNTSRSGTSVGCDAENLHSLFWRSPHATGAMRKMKVPEVLAG